MLKNVKFAKKALSMVLSFLMIAAMLTVAVSAEGEPFYGSLISADVAACESQAAVNAFNVGIGAQPRQIDSSEFHSGTGSVKVTVNIDNVSYLAFVPTEKLVSGALYRFSVWYKDSRETPSGNLNLRARDTTGAIFISGVNGSAKRPILAGGWNKYEMVFSANARMAADAFSYFYLTSDVAGTTWDIYFDDIVFERVSPYDTMLTTDVSECEDSVLTLESLKNSSADDSNKKIRALTTDYAHSGAGSLAVTSKADSYNSLFAIRPSESIVAGEKYYFSVWYNDVNSSAGNADFQLVARNSNSGGSNPTIYHQKLTSGSGWQKYFCYFTADEAYAGNKLEFIYLRAPGGFSGGTIYFDDITFKKVDISSGSGLVQAEIAALESDYALSAVDVGRPVFGADGTSRSISSSVVHSGSGSIAAVAPQYKPYISFEVIDTKLKEGKDYRFSVWYNTGSSNPGASSFDFVGRTTGGATPVLSSKTLISDGEWHEWVCYFNTSGSNTVFAGDTFRFFYIRCMGSFSGTLYFDDISLTEAPSEEVSCTESYLGDVILGEPMTVSFTGPISGVNLPTSAFVDGETLVDMQAEKVSDDSLSVIITSPLDEDMHNISFTVKDFWGRDVSVDFEFDLHYGNLVNPLTAACESSNALTTFNTYKVGDLTRALDYTNYHGGTGSVKVSVNSANLSYVSFKPLASLVEGQKYYFSIWYYDTASETPSELFHLRGRTNANGAIMMHSTAKSVETGGWKKYETTFVADANLANNLNYMYFTIDNVLTAGNRDIYFDDLFMCKVEPQSITADVYDSSDNVISAWTTGALKAKVELTNNSLAGDKYKGVIVFANYSGTGANKKLVSVDIQKFNETVAAKTTVTKIAELNVSQGNELKVFVLDSLESGKPLIPAVTK